MKYLHQRIQGVLKAVHRHGLLKYTWRLLRTVTESIYRKQVSTIFRRDLAGGVDLLDAKIELDVRPYQQQYQSALFEFLTQYERKDLIEEALSKGMIPMLGFVEANLVALSWFTTKPLYLESLELNLDYGDGSGYIEGSRTDDSVKGMGIAPAIRTRICKYLYDSGYKQVFVAAGDNNPASQAVARKCKFLPFESITMRRFLWIHHYSRKLL